MNKSSGITIAVGLVFVTLGAVLYVCSRPIFSFTHTETQTTNLPPLQESETIMNYSFVLLPGMNPNYKDVAVQMSTSQTLHIQAVSNMLNTSYYPFRTFDFSIAIPQPDGIDAVYFSRSGVTSFIDSWSPPFNATYHLKFSSVWAAYIDGMDMNAQITKTWTEAQTRTDTVTEQKPLIDFGSNFQYAIYGIAVLGIVFSLVGLTRNIRHRTRTGVQGLNKSLPKNG